MRVKPARMRPASWRRQRVKVLLLPVSCHQLPKAQFPPSLTASQANMPARAAATEPTKVRPHPSGLQLSTVTCSRPGSLHFSSPGCARLLLILCSLPLRPRVCRRRASAICARSRTRDPPLRSTPSPNVSPAPRPTMTPMVRELGARTRLISASGRSAPPLPPVFPLCSPPLRPPSSPRICGV